MWPPWFDLWSIHMGASRRKSRERLNKQSMLPAFTQFQTCVSLLLTNTCSQRSSSYPQLWFLSLNLARYTKVRSSHPYRKLTSQFVSKISRRASVAVIRWLFSSMKTFIASLARPSIMYGAMARYAIFIQFILSILYRIRFGPIRWLFLCVFLCGGHNSGP